MCRTLPSGQSPRRDGHEDVIRLEDRRVRLQLALVVDLGGEERQRVRRPRDAVAVLLVRRVIVKLTQLLTIRD